MIADAVLLPPRWRGVLVGLTGGTAHAAPKLELLVPAYFYPAGSGSDSWQALDAAAERRATKDLRSLLEHAPRTARPTVLVPPEITGRSPAPLRTPRTTTGSAGAPSFSNGKTTGW